MFVNFFLELRQAKVPVTLREYLMLMEALDRDVPHPNAVRLALERQRDDHGQAPPVAMILPEHVRARDKVVRPHSLDTYDQLKKVGHEES